MYMVTATNSDGDTVSAAWTHEGDARVQVQIDRSAAERIASEWRRDPGLSDVQIVEETLESGAEVRS